MIYTLNMLIISSCRLFICVSHLQAYIVPLDRDDLDLDPLVYQNGTESSMDARLTGRLFAHQTSSFKLPCRFTKPLVSAPVPADNNKETTGKAICSFRSNQSHCQENTWNKNPFQKFQYGSNWQCPRFSYLNLFPPSILVILNAYMIIICFV